MHFAKEKAMLINTGSFRFMGPVGALARLPAKSPATMRKKSSTVIEEFPRKFSILDTMCGETRKACMMAVTVRKRAAITCSYRPRIPLSPNYHELDRWPSRRNIYRGFRTYSIVGSVLSIDLEWGSTYAQCRYRPAKSIRHNKAE